MKILRTPDKYFKDIEDYPFDPIYTNIFANDGTNGRGNDWDWLSLFITKILPDVCPCLHSVFIGFREQCLSGTHKSGGKTYKISYTPTESD